jgi:hypothetical protein
VVIRNFKNPKYKISVLKVAIEDDLDELGCLVSLHVEVSRSFVFVVKTHNVIVLSEVGNEGSHHLLSHGSIVERCKLLEGFEVLLTIAVFEGGNQVSVEVDGLIHEDIVELVVGDEVLPVD